MKIFTLDNQYNIVCNSKKTSYGFKHTATIKKDYIEVYKTKCCYYNRTWEAYEYESVLKKAIDNYFEGKEKEKYLKVISGEQKEEQGILKTASMVASLGNILCNTEEEKNAWKKRMLGTVQGIDFPEDFDSLSEEEKQKRLDNAINIGLNKK